MLGQRRGRPRSAIPNSHHKVLVEQALGHAGTHRAGAQHRNKGEERLIPGLVLAHCHIVSGLGPPTGTSAVMISAITFIIRSSSFRSVAATASSTCLGFRVPTMATSTAGLA